jgi:hypothetical protein
VELALRPLYTAAIVAACALCAACGGHESPASATTPGAQYERVFDCLSLHGYVGLNKNRGGWPRILVMVGKKKTENDIFIFNGTIYRSEAAARGDAAANATYLGGLAARNKKIKAPSSHVRSVGWHWLSARYVSTPAAQRCVRTS